MNKYICKYCGRTFKANFALTRHINVIHLKIMKIICNKNKKLCQNCKKYFTLSNFNKHYKSCISNKCRNRHKDVKEILDKCIIKNNKYICPICNKEFSKMGIGTHILENALQI